MTGFLVQFVAGVILLHAPCPVYTDASCYVQETRTIYLNSVPSERRVTEAHEYGHAYYFDRLDNRAGRQWIRHVLGYNPGHPFWGAGVGVDDYSPGEAFADAYAVCATGEGRAWTGPTDANRISPRRIRRLCRALPPSLYGLFLRKVMP